MVQLSVEWNQGRKRSLSISAFWKKNMMLENFDVEDYRGFRKLHVEGLRRVNLIVGRNNSGKTSLLEAAHILL